MENIVENIDNCRKQQEINKVIGDNTMNWRKYNTKKNTLFLKVIMHKACPLTRLFQFNDNTSIHVEQFKTLTVRIYKIDTSFLLPILWSRKHN